MTRARDDGTDTLRWLVAESLAESGVTEGRMFNGVGFRTDGRVFAFVGHAGELMVKVPQSLARSLVADGAADPVTMGMRTMREWVTIPSPPDGDPTAWRTASVAAHAFVGGRSA